METGGEIGLEYTDMQIIEKCLDGDHEAFSEIVFRYKKLIYSVVAKMLEDRQEINDVAQEAFLKIYKSLGQYNPEFQFSTWVVKITTNLCLDIRKKKKPITVPLEEVYELTSSFESPETALINKEQKRKLLDALNSLPEKYKTPLILFHQSGLSYEELMQVLKQPMTIIKNRLYRARLMLKDKILKD
jgi:RNA polymerase sigma factor (sigma-70 family)